MSISFVKDIRHGSIWDVFLDGKKTRWYVYGYDTYWKLSNAALATGIDLPELSLEKQGEVVLSLVAMYAD
jgi:hypothetical protein